MLEASKARLNVPERTYHSDSWDSSWLGFFGYTIEFETRVLHDYLSNGFTNKAEILNELLLPQK